MTNTTKELPMATRSTDSLMTAIVQDRYGSADVLQLRKIDRPQPRVDEVIVHVHAAGVDFGVWHHMASYAPSAQHTSSTTCGKTALPGGRAASP